MRPSFRFRAFFPDAGCAKFSVYSADPKDHVILDSLVATFRPAPSPIHWLRPFLPEVWRSDCHYRFDLSPIQRFLDRLLD